MKRKDPAAVALGRKGGKVGGLSRSPAKIAAGKRNIAKARAAYQAERQRIIEFARRLKHGA